MASSKSSTLAYFAMVAVAMAAMAATTTVVEAQNTPQDFVRLHNEARARAGAGIGPVTWDDGLARYAHDHAAKLAACDCRKVDNNHLDLCGPHGQNVFWAAPGGGRCPSTWNATDAVAAWVGEKQWYNRGGNVCSPPPWAGKKTCGHYTQVVWRGTTRIGCARVECDGGHGGGVLFVCNYDPRGNVYGQPPY